MDTINLSINTRNYLIKTQNYRGRTAIYKIAPATTRRRKAAIIKKTGRAEQPKECEFYNLCI